MAVSRRLRFEILRRDNYTCRYCGATSPDVTLAVDHVVPTTLGGSDEPSNLVTACTDCNSGKTSIAPDSVIVEDIDAASILLAKAMERVATIRRNEMDERDTVVSFFDDQWRKYGAGRRDNNWPESVGRFYSLGLNTDDLNDMIYTAVRRAHDDGQWRYFCGCCWKEITTRQEMARQMIEDGHV